MASILRRTVVAILLAVWSFPAAASTGTETGTPAPITSPATGTRSASTGAGAASSDAQQYAAREKQTQGLQDFQGGEGYIYIGGGVLTAVLLVLLILILI
jgi:hypothetical protein